MLDRLKALSFLLFILMLTAITGCKGGGQSATTAPPETVPIPPITKATNKAIPNNQHSEEMRIALFGNSHVSGLAPLIQQAISAGNPQRPVAVVNLAGGFLDNSQIQSTRESAITQESWTHLVLQGQKYSQSGTVTYPTSKAQAWIKLAKDYNITPILFPEHPQRGDTTEATRVHQLHVGIANQQSACIAPVGLVWDRVQLLAPNVVLHASDGNHASYTGKVLTTFVFYEVITGEPADLLPVIPEFNVPANTQQLFKQVVSEVLQTHTPCQFP